VVGGELVLVGFHGSPGEISLRDDLTHKGDEDEVDLDGIADLLLNGLRHRTWRHIPVPR